jgi:Fe-S-cluster containining protein
MNHWKEKALQDYKVTEAYFRKIRRTPPKQLDVVMEGLHEAVFAETDCLACANCCKTTSPIFRDKDIDRIARHLSMRPADFVSRYLHIDEDGDYVLNEAPCPFLGADNYCAIYEVRPKACSAYPHTNRKHFHQILSLTLNNTLVCPATYTIIKRLQAVLPG